MEHEEQDLEPEHRPQKLQAVMQSNAVEWGLKDISLCGLGICRLWASEKDNNRSRNEMKRKQQKKQKKKKTKSSIKTENTEAHVHYIWITSLCWSSIFNPFSMSLLQVVGSICR